MFGVSAFLSPVCCHLSAHECALAMLDPLEIFREGLALFRRAGLSWLEAKDPAREAALSVFPRPEDINPELSLDRIARCGPAERNRRHARRRDLEAERDEWDMALQVTRTAWMRAYERRPITREDLPLSR